MDIYIHVEWIDGTASVVLNQRENEIMKMRAAIMIACASTLIFSAGEAMAKKKNAKEICLEKGGIWRAVGGDQSSWTCYMTPKSTNRSEIFDRWGNLVTNSSSAPVKE